MISDDSKISGMEFKRSKADTFSKIRIAALQLFVRHGYQAVGLRQIAQEIGVQAGSLYNHINGKQELLFELIYDLEFNLTAQVTRAADKKALSSKRLEFFVSSYVDFASANKDLHTLALRDGVRLEGGFGEEVIQLRRKRSLLLEEILLQGQSQGEFGRYHNHFAVGAVVAVLQDLVTETASCHPVDELRIIACDLALKIFR